MAQNESIPPKGIKVIACVKKDQVILRWAPNSSMAWTNANKYGYIIEKYIIVKDGKMVNKPTRILLSPQPMKPQPLDKWEPAINIQKDSYAAIAAQAIYGGSFNLETKDANIYEVIKKSEEVENRFGFALFSADQSIPASELMGLRMSDKDIVKGEKYLYRVYANVPSSILKIDTGIVFVEADKITEYPLPRELKLEVADKALTLKWDTRYVRTLYSGYFIERSGDMGKTWTPRNTVPHQTLSKRRKPIEIFSFLDTLPANDVSYSYRIRGKTFFGEITEPSVTVTGKGRALLDLLPKITGVQEVDKSKVRLDFSIEPEFNSKIREFKLYIGGNPLGPYKVLKKMLAADRFTLLENLQSSNYFVVAAITKDSMEYKSNPVLFQLQDTVPPAIPIGLKGTIDTNGVVLLTWNKNKEFDFHGYRVFVANAKHEEFANLTKLMKPDTFFRETINIKTLDKKRFYKITALDNHFNSSEYSIPLELIKPDLIPPSPPLFNNIITTDTAIILEWIASSSDDISGHLIFRSIAGSNEWLTLEKYDKDLKAGTYIDRSSDPQYYYEYMIVAVDDSKNESFSKKMKAKLLDKGVRAKILGIVTDINRESKEITINWKYQKKGVEKIYVYRKGNDDPLKIYESVSGDKDTFTDKALKMNTKYVYRLMAEHTDGGSSPLSEEIIIQY